MGGVRGRPSRAVPGAQVRLGRRRFADVVDRQLDLFAEDEAALLAEAAETDAAWTAAPREESEERYGDYQLVVDAVADRLADLRDHYASALDDATADGYRDAFNRAATKRFGRFASALRD
jgi:hypothetical protein